MTSFEIKLSAQQLMSTARERTNIDIKDAAIEAPLDRLLLSLNTEAQLSESGSQGIENRLMRVLCNRLRMQRDFKQHPEIDEQQIVRPLFITGAPRTGSTKLHKLLAASGDFLYLPCWQGQCLALRTGNRDENPAMRIQEADEENCFFNEHAPMAKLVHEYLTLEPEEDMLIYEHFLFHSFYNALAFVPGYLQWYQERRNLVAEFEFLRQSLKYLQWQFHDGDPRPWLLKAPLYNANAHRMPEFFPDAGFVTTHRNPVNQASSLPSLYHNFYKAYSDAERKQLVGTMALEGLLRSMQQHMAIRDSHPDLNFLDIGYTELTKVAEQVMEKVYSHTGMPLSSGARLAMLNWDFENRQHKHGVHEHKMEEYFLTPEMVTSRLEDYIARFGHYF